MLPHGNNYTFWPDGTLGAKPTDKTVFIDHRDGSVWVWEEAKSSWIKGGWSNSDLDLEDIEIEELNWGQKKSVVNCECGSSSVGSSKHSVWCPAHKGDI